jgi:ABC-type Fe3+ transport system substrate-binding protein
MKRTYFTQDDTLYDIITRYPQTRDHFITQGFPQFSDQNQLERFGRLLSFKAAMKAKKKNPGLFMELLFDVIDHSSMLQEQGVSISESNQALSIAGILPCPVRIPLLDKFEQLVSDHEKQQGLPVSYNLQSASQGVGWLEDQYKDAENEHQIPDLALSAGFELFFDQKLIGRFRDSGTFCDLSSLSRFSRDFDGLDLKDPKGNYSILAGVPAVFLVDTIALGERKVPSRWEDLLSDELQESVSLPVEDLDLFNAVCLQLENRFGIDAVRKLGENMLRSMHPSQMVKNSGKTDKPAVTVLPWFFTRMIFAGTSLKIIWPEDGAILSPIFAAAKRSKGEQLSPILSFFESREIGQLMREKGMFPSVNPEVDNALPPGASFQWLGWDAIYASDIGARIRTCTEVFNLAMSRGGSR